MLINLKVTVNDLVIKYTDPLYTFGVTIGQLHTYACSESFQHGYIVCYHVSLSLMSLLSLHGVIVQS